MVGRRAPKAGERLRDAERTRERILDAALIEFGAHGFTGARISAIADRAGANKQLISYYFGGKRGLYDELADRFRQRALEQAATEASADQVVAEFVRSALNDRDWARLMAWEQLGDRGRSPVDPAQREFMQSQVRYVTVRQERGELPADIDPSYLLLALITAASASVVLPNLARGIVDEDPESPEFHQRYAEELAKLVRHLHP